MNPSDRLVHLAAGWLALAVVLLALVEIAPGSNRFVVWTLGLVALYLLLTNTSRLDHAAEQLVTHLAGGTA